MTSAQRSLEYIDDGMILGLGSGRAARNFVRALGTRIQAGLQIQGIPTSQETADLARQLGIPLTTLAQHPRVDVTVDGADEVDPHCNLIKGYGAALVREKIVAASSKRLIILVGPEKLVPMLGHRGILPVEIVPFGVALCSQRLTELGCPATVRSKQGDTVLSDNGNYILDCQVEALSDPQALEQAILTIPGVVGTGLFLGMADAVLIEDGDGAVTVRERAA